MSVDVWVVLCFSVFCANLYYHHFVDTHPERPRREMWAWIALMVGWVLPLYALGAGLGMGLRRLAARLSWFILTLTGMPVQLQDATLHLPRNYLDITPVCDGFYTLYFLVTLCLFMAGVFELAAKTRILFVAAAASLALLSNGVRIAILAWVVHARGAGVLESHLHGAIGSVTFVLSLATLTFCAW